MEKVGNRKLLFIAMRRQTFGLVSGTGGILLGLGHHVSNQWR